MRCEVRFPPEGGYDLIITAPDGTERLESFANADAFEQRQAGLQLSSRRMDGMAHTSGTAEVLASSAPSGCTQPYS